MDSESAASIAQEFRLGDYQEHVPLDGGSVYAMKFVTLQGTFFIKAGESEETVRKYAKVAEPLRQCDIPQPKLFIHRDGSYLSPTGFSVYEFYLGEASSNPTVQQADALMTYLGKYNRCLAGIPLPPDTYSIDELARRTGIFERSDSLDYLLDQFTATVSWQTVSARSKDICFDSLNFLSSVRDEFTRLKKQLIHGDLVPGNILYQDDTVVAIIDFSPYYESHLYSVCICLYWHFIFMRDGQVDLGSIERALQVYASAHPVSEPERSLLFPMLVKAAGRYLCAKIGFNQIEPRFSEDDIDGMAAMVTRLFDARSALERCL